MPQRPVNNLPQQISRHFNLDELRALCYDLEIDYENLRGETKDARVLALVQLCARHGLTEKLLALCREHRPRQTWKADRFDPPVENETRQQYCRHLIDRYKFLDFRGLGQTPSSTIHLALEAAYVPLNGRINRLLGSSSRAETKHPDAIQPLLTLLQKNDGLIVLGPPGAGKTTWLKYLALRLAQDEGQQLGLGDRLPLVLSLSAYASALAEKDVPLNHFLATFYQNLGFTLPLDNMIQTALEQGNALLLLDGLDEVAEPGLRQVLSNRLTDFYTIHRSAGNKFVFTSRTAGYDSVRLVADGLLECTVTPLDLTQIETFVTQWTGALAGQIPSGETSAPVAADKNRLMALLAENSAVQELAGLPLLLTILLLIRQQRVQLPERRVDLYHLYLRTLLEHWQTVRSLDRPPSRQMDGETMLHILAPLALWMHESNPQLSQAKPAALRRQLMTQLEALGDASAQQSADTFLQEIQTVTGLLVATGPDSIGFLHLTFQEYAAALALARSWGENQNTLVADLNRRLTRPGWDEVVILTISILAREEHRPAAANRLLEGLLSDASPEDSAERAVILAEAALMIGDDLVEEKVKTAVSETVLAVAKAPTVPARRRVQAGALLGQLGDPRTSVHSVEEMLFCYVPGGPFWLGRTDQATQYEQLREPFWLGAYPVTQAQFSVFVLAGGYEMPELWPEAAAVNRWRMGEVQDWAQRGWRTAPWDYGRPFNLPNHPVVGITWFEALAFCRWLTRRWQQEQFLTEAWEVRLPTEVAWEQAARGGLQIPQKPHILPAAEAMANPYPSIRLTENPAPTRSYPGQTSLTPEDANINDTAVATSNAIGCFSQASPVGCQEMCGNVWEWTASRFRPYPYQPDDGREALDVKLYDEMVLRGGAYWSNVRSANVTFRARRSPNDQNSSYGFRLMLAAKKA